MGAVVEREAGKVCLQGVKGWFVGDQGSSVHAAQASIMRALGEDVTYAHQLGVSGLAFRLQVHGELCPSSPHSACGWGCIERSLAALPWTSRGLRVKADDAAGVAEARCEVVASLERGVPVQYGSEEDGVIFGYEQDGAAWHCHHPFHSKGREPYVETGWPWGLGFYGEPKAQAPDRRALAIDAMRQAVAMAEATESGGYAIGFTAWDQWPGLLRRAAELPDDQRRGRQQGNAWIYECLVNGRAGAAEYLREVVELFGGVAARAMEEAAGCYERLSRSILTTPERCSVTVAPYPWMEAGKDWTDGMRAEQIERLAAGRAVEHEAVVALRRALVGVA
jgi:hypothetical protein